MKVEDVLKTVKTTVALVNAAVEVIKAVQTVLKQLELYRGDVDGVPGQKTQEAFNEFKEKEYLGYEGLLGQTTAEALIEAYEPREAAHDVASSKISPIVQTTLPVVGKVRVNTPIIPGGHFTWGEATKGLTRKPESENVVRNIIKIAKVMEEVRNLFDGRPITVNSWYRPPRVNAAVGGAKGSRHIVGDAVDFTVQGLTPWQVHAKLEPWYGNRGGVASASSFTHIDGRGYRARWRYGV